MYASGPAVEPIAVTPAPTSPASGTAPIDSNVRPSLVVSRLREALVPPWIVTGTMARVAELTGVPMFGVSPATAPDVGALTPATVLWVHVWPWSSLLMSSESSSPPATTRCVPTHTGVPSRGASRATRSRPTGPTHRTIEPPKLEEWARWLALSLIHI